MDEFGLRDHDAQPICPACGVTTNPDGDEDVCLECGYRIGAATGDDEF